MSLSVYTIKHPLVMNWTNYILHNQFTESEKFTLLNKIGLSLIYEATRKSISLQHLYLQKIDEITEINILTNTLKCSILTNIYLSQILSKDIIDIIPLSTIYPIFDTQHTLNLEAAKASLANNSIDHPIILIEESLNTNTVIQILDNIIEKNNIEKNIQICCVVCKTSTLQVLGTRYSNLNIYTTQIINDNNN